MKHNLQYHVSLCSDEGPAERRRRSRLRGTRGLPPVTPNACVRDAVCSEVFDQIWNEIITVLQPLLASVREKGIQGMQLWRGIR